MHWWAQNITQHGSVLLTMLNDLHTHEYKCVCFINTKFKWEIYQLQYTLAESSDKFGRKCGRILQPLLVLEVSSAVGGIVSSNVKGFLETLYAQVRCVDEVTLCSYMSLYGDTYIINFSCAL